MKAKIKVGPDNNISIPAKKTWVKPDIEIIGHNNVQSGQAGIFQEATFTGFDPISLYNS